MNTEEQRKMQYEMKEKSKQCRIYRPEKAHVTAERGLIGAEHDTLKAMFSEDGKEALKFDKLSSPQKKVLRKMGYPKQYFLNIPGPTKKV